MVKFLFYVMEFGIRAKVVEGVSNAGHEVQEALGEVDFLESLDASVDVLVVDIERYDEKLQNSTQGYPAIVIGDSRNPRFDAPQKHQRVYYVDKDDDAEALCIKVETGAKFLVAQRPIYERYQKLEKNRGMEILRERILAYCVLERGFTYEEANRKLTKFCRSNRIKISDLAKQHEEFMETRAKVRREMEEVLRRNTPDIIHLFHADMDKERL